MHITLRKISLRFLGETGVVAKKITMVSRIDSYSFLPEFSFFSHFFLLEFSTEISVRRRPGSLVFLVFNVLLSLNMYIYCEKISINRLKIVDYLAMIEIADFH